jgi:ABC-type lipoprotein export system ATPase subunit
MTAIVARDLFRVHAGPQGAAAALQGLSLTVEAGEIVTVLGPSGAGKTSLLRILAGLDAPSAGTARVFGADLGRLGPRGLGRYRASTIGYVDQHYSQALASELDARELVALRLRLAGMERGERLARAEELLGQVGLAGKAGARAAELSGGEQQRVAVCAALAHRPRLLLADEPTGELDGEAARLVYDAIAELVRSHRCTALVVSHDPASTAFADRTVRIRDGRVSTESSGRAAGEELIVVGRGGWLRLPEELLDRAGIRSHARATLEPGGIVVAAPAGRAEARDGAAPQPVELPDAPAGGVVAELRDVRKTYGEGAAAAHPLDGLSATFTAGRFYAVTGPSGSGKTTLLHLLSGLELPTSGEIDVLGRSVPRLDREARASLRRAHVAVVEQQSGLISFLTARENVELGLAVRGANGAARARATESLAAVGLVDRADQQVARLSSGEQARVAIARALATGCVLLIADEPTARLDQANAIAVAALFARLARESGITVVCATHDPLVIEQADEELPLSPALLPAA